MMLATGINWSVSENLFSQSAMAKTGENGKGQQRTGSLKSNFEATGAATKNLRRFGQSIKRVVREVKEDSGTTEPRDVLVERNNRLSAAIRILNEEYQI